MYHNHGTLTWHMRVSLNSEVFFFDIHCFLKIHGNDQKRNGS